MIIYRMEKEKYQDYWPSRGALYSEGRWNKPGQWIVYCSESIALCKLEVLANSGNLPIKRVVISIEIPDEAPIYELAEDLMPPFWYGIPYPDVLSEITGEFIKDNSYVAMKVPSAQSKREFNYLLNPAHPEFSKIVKVVSKDAENFDSRLKGSNGDMTKN